MLMFLYIFINENYHCLDSLLTVIRNLDIGLFKDYSDSSCFFVSLKKEQII